MLSQDSRSVSREFMPLAARMRPSKLDDYVGQDHILGEGKPLRKALQAGYAHSMILWGPPGTGKTTLAELVANCTGAKVERLSAVSSGVKDIRQAIEAAKLNAESFKTRTILFVDEVHRFNKSQQDAFLPYIEDGTVTFVGATTENPAFELNSALLSRSRVYILKKLTLPESLKIVERALTDEANGFGGTAIDFPEQLKEKLCVISDGDARRLLNLLELCLDMCEEVNGIKQVTEKEITDLAGRSLSAMDKGGDYFYDLISAFHKSVRGSSPDAALYWYSRMLVAGVDPLYVARRLLAIASEDIGNADPRAMEIALNAWDCFQRVGPAEGEHAIAQATVYCACAAKSNAVYKAFKKAKTLATETESLEVPNHLRNAPTTLAKSMGHGEGYRYAHDEEKAYAAGEVYLPLELANTTFYQPSDRGMEIKIKEKLAFLKQLDEQSSNKRYAP